MPLTLQAAAAGKHVLCEKPIALSAARRRRCARPPARVHIEEAFMVRHHPQWQRARELVRAGRIGTLRAVQVFFSYFNDDPANIRNQPAIGGGALYDIGCYAILGGRYLFEASRARGIALVDRDPALGTDRTTSALLDFGGGRQLGFTVSTQSCALPARAGGRHAGAHRDRRSRSTRRRAARCGSRSTTAATLDGSGIAIETLPAADQYRLQAEAFSRRVRGEEAPCWGMDDAIAQMRVIDALWRSERSGRWEDIA